MTPPPSTPDAAPPRLRLIDAQALVGLAAAPLALLAVYARQPDIPARDTLCATLGICAAGICLALSWHASHAAFKRPHGAARGTLELASLIAGGAAFSLAIWLYFLSAWVGAFTALWQIAILGYLAYRG